MSQTNKTLKIFNLKGATKGKTALPEVFSSTIRPEGAFVTVRQLQET